MQRIVKTILNKNWNVSDEIISLLLDSSYLLVTQEIDLLKKINQDKKESGETAQGLLSEQFPQMFYGFDDVQELPDEKSFRVYVNRLIEDRRKVKTSQILINLADSVQNNGLKITDLEDLRKYVSDEKKEEQNPLLFDYFGDMQTEVTKEKGYKSFIKEIDDDIKAFDSGTLVSIFAFTSQFKTTLAQNICFKNAMEGKNSVYISLEVPKRMILWKMIFSFAQNQMFKYHPTYWDMFTNFEWMHQNRPEVYEYLFDTIIPSFQNMSGKIIVYDESDFPEYTEAAFRKKIEDADDLMNNKLHGVFWDQASLLKFSDNRGHESYAGETINRFVSFIRRMGNAFRKNEDGSWRYLTNIVLAQANRQSFLSVARDTENIGRYSLTGIAEANEIERASSYVMSIFTNEELRSNKEATVQLLKCRNGKVLEEPIRIHCDGRTGVLGESVMSFKSSSGISDDSFNLAREVVGSVSGWDDVFS